MEETLLKNYIKGAEYLECILYFLKFPSLGNKKDIIADALLKEHFLCDYNKKNEVYKIIEDIICDVKDISTQNFTNWYKLHTILDIASYDSSDESDEYNDCYDSDDDYEDYYNSYNYNVKYSYKEISYDRIRKYNQKLYKLKKILNPISQINGIMCLDENLIICQNNEGIKFKNLQNSKMSLHFQNTLNEIENKMNGKNYNNEYLDEIFFSCYKLSSVDIFDVENVYNDILTKHKKLNKIISIYDSIF